MEASKKTKILFTVLASTAILITVYSALAYSVASNVQQYNGVLIWPTPGYTFLPWPIAPTGLVIAIVEPLNQTDTKYYQYIINSGVLIVLTIVFWLAIFLIVMKSRKLLHLKD
jgi:uncharacterized membrane protein